MEHPQWRGNAKKATIYPALKFGASKQNIDFIQECGFLSVDTKAFNFIEFPSICCRLKSEILTLCL